ncbi:hypothetical protein RTP6_002718 [Batrachochytrium dendrobatidis]
MSDAYESVLCVIKECLVYRIPPRATAKGYRASEWDTTQFLWSGRLRVIAVGDECALHLEDPVTGELFAKCPYDLEGTAVEPVIDSSRYFVIRVVDPTSGSHAFLGLGVAERSWAFDLNVALQDHTKRVRAANQIIKPTALNNEPNVDYSLKEGQMIQMNLGISQKKHNALDETTQIVKLQPPQKPGRNLDQQEFGDFNSAVAVTQNTTQDTTRNATRNVIQNTTQNTTQNTAHPMGWTTF